MKVVIIISATAEWKAVRELFPDIEITQSPYGDCSHLIPFESLHLREPHKATPGTRRQSPAASPSTPDTSNLKPDTWNLILYHSGWGKIASAGTMQYVIDHERPDLIVNLGTCGGIEGLINRDDVVLVDRTMVYDIVELMGDPDVKTYYASTLNLSWLSRPYPHPVRRGLVAGADSDIPPDKIAFLKSEGVIAADWESAALAWVARKNGARLLILRGVSDVVSQDAGEAYDNYPLFQERTRAIMRKLFDQLPDWLNAVRI